MKYDEIRLLWLLWPAEIVLSHGMKMDEMDIGQKIAKICSALSGLGLTLWRAPKSSKERRDQLRGFPTVCVFARRSE